MKDEERKAWEELVEYTRMEDAPIEFMGPMKSDGHDWVNSYDNAILAADAELTRLREEVGQLRILLKSSGGGKEAVEQIIKDHKRLSAIVARLEDVEGTAKVIDDVGRAMALLSTIHFTGNLPHEIARAVRDHIKEEPTS